MLWFFHSPCLTGGMAFMAGNQFQFRTVDEDFPFGGLESQDVGDEGEGHGIEVGLELDEALGRADPEGDLGTVVRVCGQGKESVFFLLFKELDNDSSGGIVKVWVGFSRSHQRAVARRCSRSWKSRALRRFFSTNKNGASILPFVSG